MTQNWVKGGKIYTGRSQVPTVHIRDEKTWRIYFSDRTADNRSFIRYIDVEAGNPTNVLYEHKEMLLPWGKLGTFDHDGIMPSWLIKDRSGLLRLYYIGWTQRKDVPYHNSIGLAISRDNGDTFTKYSEGPVLADGLDETYFTGTSCVLPKNNKYEIWYLSCTEWVKGTPAEPRYNIKHRYSVDGIHWDVNSRSTSVDYKSPKEGGICRASVIVEEGFYKMWYCYRQLENYRTDKNSSYRIGFSQSNDGVNWLRMDEEVNLDVSADGWDSGMLCYPHVIKHKNTYFMFYNGNGFGQSGLGFATLSAENP